MATTATLLLEPGSRAIAFISTIPLKISGTSISKSRFNRFLSDLETIISGPLAVIATSTMYSFSFCPCLYLSVGTCSRSGSSASVRPRSTIICLGSNLWIVPVVTSSERSAYSSKTSSLSASLSRCITTCLAVCAAMRPARLCSDSISITSPTLAFGLSLSAPSRLSSVLSSSTS